MGKVSENDSKADSRFLELCRVIVRFNHVARFIANGKSQHRVSGC